jgi:hypothetical protein
MRFIAILFTAILISTTLIVAGCGYVPTSVISLPPIATANGQAKHLDRPQFIPSPSSVGLTTRDATTIGATLTTTAGSWIGQGIITYAYQWQHCNSTATTCTSISNATGTSYTVVSGDNGYYIRVAVTATNIYGSSLAYSALTSLIGSAPQTTGCFNSPGACGYPDPAYNNVGVTSCSALSTWSPTNLTSGTYTLSGSTVTIDANNVTISGANISGYEFSLQGNGTTFTNDCIAASGSSGSTSAIYGGGTGTTVQHSTISATGCTVAQARTQECTSTNALGSDVCVTSGATVNANVLVGAEESVNCLTSNDLIENNYMISDGLPSGVALSNIHSEDVYVLEAASNISITGNTLFNPHDESGVVFLDDYNSNTQSDPSACADTGTISITGNLIAGGGFPIYGCSGATTYPNPIIFSGNDLARLPTTQELAEISAEPALCRRHRDHLTGMVQTRTDSGRTLATTAWLTTCPVRTGQTTPTMTLVPQPPVLPPSLLVEEVAEQPPLPQLRLLRLPPPVRLPPLEPDRQRTASPLRVHVATRIRTIRMLV